MLFLLPWLRHCLRLVCSTAFAAKRLHRPCVFHRTRRQDSVSCCPSGARSHIRLLRPLRPPGHLTAITRVTNSPCSKRGLLANTLALIASDVCQIRPCTGASGPERTRWPPTIWWVLQEGRHFVVCLFVHTKYLQKAGPFSVARPKMDLPFHNRLAYSRVHRRSAGPLGAAHSPCSKCGLPANTTALIAFFLCFSLCFHRPTACDLCLFEKR